jgi:hypothetical protein
LVNKWDIELKSYGQNVIGFEISMGKLFIYDEYRRLSTNIVKK